MTTQQSALGIDEVAGQIGRLTQRLLEEGAEPSQIAFALVSIATDMGLHVTGEPLTIFAVLLDAIALQARSHLKKKEERTTLDMTEVCPAQGGSIH